MIKMTKVRQGLGTRISAYANLDLNTDKFKVILHNFGVTNVFITLITCLSRLHESCFLYLDVNLRYALYYFLRAISLNFCAYQFTIYAYFSVIHVPLWNRQFMKGSKRAAKTPYRLHNNHTNSVYTYIINSQLSTFCFLNDKSSIIM